MQRELVERAIGGDYDAFSSLVRASTSRQYAIATLILRDGDRAQDAVQEALVSAWKGMRALRDPDAWDAWLHRLTVRACYQAGPARASAGPGRAARDARPGRRQEPRTLRWSWRTVTVSSGQLGRLPIDQRAVIVLHFYVGLPLTEVADILDIPHGTAKSRLHRGLEAAALGPARRTRSVHESRSRSGWHDQRRPFRASCSPPCSPTSRRRASRTVSSPRSLRAARRERRWPRWLALIKEPPMRISSRVAVGSPTFRLASLMAITLALIIALGAAVVAGASLLPSPAP